MSFFGKWNPALLAAALWVAASGCSPMDQGPLEEEKEPHYVLGKSRVNAMNYAGAIEAFEESLAANPHSAQAHYQLAMLFENQESDPAAAIYHYQQFLKFNPKAENAEIIAQRIASCKQQLAYNVLQLPSAPAAQQQLEKLTEENRRLHVQLDQLQTYAAWLATKTNPPAAQNNYLAQPPATSLTPNDVTTAAATTQAGPATTQRKPAPPKTSTASTARTHIVASGDTMASIARKRGVNLGALQLANPGVNPKKLKAGQVLKLPAP